MDPFSLVTGAVSLAEVCFRIVQHIRKFKHEMSGIHQELAHLSNEVEALADVCTLIKDSLEAYPPPAAEKAALPGRSAAPSPSPNAKTTADNLWEYLDKNIKNCSVVVSKLEAVVHDVCGSAPSHKGASLREGYGKLARKKSCDDELRHYRSQLDMYQNGLHLIFSIIIMHDTRGIQNQNARSFHDLTEDLRNLDGNIQSQISDIKAFSGGQQYDAAVLAALGELQSSIGLAAASIEKASANQHFDTPQSVSSIFTGREALLQDLRAFLVPPPGVVAGQQRRFVIHGLGGSGKTQFCCKFAEDNRDSFWGVFWLDASTEDRLQQTLGSIAKDYAQREKNVATALHWLSNLPHTWLLIIDNADDPAVKLEKYFPKGNRGSILITTKNPTHKLHGNVGPGHYDFRGLDFNAATSLLLKASSQPRPWDASLELLAAQTAEALGFLALALIHAGAAIRDKLCTMSEYPAYFNRSWKRIRGAKTKKLTENDTVYATWELCYKRLAAKESEAASDATQLLNTFAFFHWETISPEILSRALRNAALEAEQQDKDAKAEKIFKTTMRSRRSAWREWLNSQGLLVLMFMFKNRSPEALPAMIREGRQTGCLEDSQDRIRLALNELAQMSLLLYNDNKGTYFMHPMVHTWARERFSLAEQTLWADVAARVLAASILLPPLGTAVEDDIYHVRLLPHVDHVQKCRSSVARLRPKKPGATVHNLLPALDRERIRVLSKFGLVYAKCGAWAEAESLLTEVREFLNRHLGHEHELSRRVGLILSNIYFEQGRGPDAQRLQKSLLEICIESLGPDHPDTLRTMGKLGYTLWQQGEYTAAHSMQQQAMLGLEEKLGRDHADTLDAADRLGLIVGKFWTPSDMERAHRLHKRAVEGMTRLHGPTHERTLLAKENLCRIAVHLGGEPLRATAGMMDAVLATRRANLGREHPYTLLAMVNAAIVKSAGGHHRRAEQLLRDGLEIADRTLTENHIGTLFGRHTLACVLREQGRYEDAVEVLVDVTERQTAMASNRGDYHPDRLGALIELANCYYLLGDVGGSLQVLGQVLHGFESITNLGHPLAKATAAARDQMLALQARGEDVKGAHEACVSFPSILFRVDKA